jgi:hypothetical protein
MPTSPDYIWPSRDLSGSFPGLRFSGTTSGSLRHINSDQSEATHGGIIRQQTRYRQQASGEDRGQNRGKARSETRQQIHEARQPQRRTVEACRCSEYAYESSAEREVFRIEDGAGKARCSNRAGRDQGRRAVQPEAARKGRQFERCGRRPFHTSASSQHTGTCRAQASRH